MLICLRGHAHEQILRSAATASILPYLTKASSYNKFCVHGVRLVNPLEQPLHIVLSILSLFADPELITTFRTLLQTSVTSIGEVSWVLSVMPKGRS
jgi:hypothetical protein